ncbi:MAG: cyclic beta 1-2 glucan synthetase [Deltaproteobacteria bacterium]|nr:cyclic beta 1-2 glucan synthetase [Deltaproteobacteria bacterium]
MRAKGIFRNLLHRKARIGSNSLAQAYTNDEPPLRSELFSIDQMKQHSKALAESHKLSLGHASDRLLTRLAENEGILSGTHNLLTEAVKANRRIVPAGEWLLDNFYLIEEQIRMARRHLPKRYSRGLPRLMNGSSAGLPRVYDIALEIISHGDGRADPESLSSFVAAYQTVTILKLGELWAVPIMLRLALIENLRRVGARIAGDQIHRNRSEYWADRMMGILKKDPKSLILVIADMARSSPPLESSFVAEFARRLQGQGPALALPLTWIEQRLSEAGLTIERLVQAENRQQAADQVSLSNSISSLRFLGAMDWREFVETMSAVEQTLREDPGGVYGRMDFATRDRYRHVVEKIAKSSPLSERDVASQAIRLAREEAGKDNSDDRAAHVGFYLLEEGLPQIEEITQVRRSHFEALRRLFRQFPLLFYMGIITLITSIFTGSLLAKAHTMEYYWLIALIALILLLSASHLAVALANWLATLLATPHLLPRMDFSGGIPPESRTLAVIPAMLTSAQNIEDLVEALEVRFLANRDDHLHFGLLTDFPDAKEKTMPDDEPLLRLAERRIQGLNEKHRASEADRFFLFHRPRRWNPQEQIWMGYERKRGKLADLNSLLRGDKRDRFSLIVGDIAVLSNVKYVITLDTDTQLPRDSAWQFVGAMVHPLNRARYNEDKQRIEKGYGILQPRVAMSLTGMNRSRYALLCGPEPGIDPYTRVVSDVYQDLFGEGSFIGKGIYDVEAFERALKGRFPENRILSHDLVEGCYARAGLLSDVLLYEEYPSSYSSDVSRRHRWIRGDWQIARWLLPGVPGLGESRRKNPLSGLSRWKIFDNLRRSLVPAALTLMLLLGWTVLSSPWLWTLAVIGTILIPSWMVSFLDLFQKPGDMRLRQHLAVEVRSAVRHSAQAAFTLACLPYEAYFSLDAIVRTAWRMWVTHKRLLEWNLSSDADRKSRTDLATSWRTMWLAPVLAVATAIYLSLSRPAALAVAGAFLVLWFASPVIAWWISRPLSRRGARLAADQVLFLRRLSRKTWAFFETFVGPEDHWLPPDNFQEHSTPVVAHRTSPTNMGLALLANLSAYDFGYIPAGQLIERTVKAFHTMETLERYHGHFYNWYDTRSLKPLPPMYISTVDSGNLAAHLLTLRSGLLALPDSRILQERLFDGLGDTMRILVDAAGDSATALFARLQKDLASPSDSLPITLVATRQYLDRLATAAREVVGSLDSNPVSQTSEWAQAFARQCLDALDELTFLAPWALLPAFPDRLNGLLGLDRNPTLRELARFEVELLPIIEDRLGSNPTTGEREWLGQIRPLITRASYRARDRIAAIDRLAREAGKLAYMEYNFLFDKARHLLAIGYNVAERRLDSSYYDLLASEARLSTFVAIAQGQLPQESWFALGRLLTIAGGEPILLSWSGSMFEYLMPLLVMPTYVDTLLNQTCLAAVERQIAYGRSRGLPWGVSESGYNAIDVHRNYQYRAFGVPGLGLKRGLADDLVIAPYASALALMVAPEEACLNLQRLAAEGLEGKYGFYEAVDYTPSRLPRGKQSAVVRSFMAHHEGMSLLSLAYLLLDRPMQKRFESDPMFQATTLLLQERIPKASAFYCHNAEVSDSWRASILPETPVRVFSSPDTPIPEVQLLSNGKYHVMVTNSGGGYSRWKGMDVTRWREDSTCDNWGTFCYLRDVKSGEFWSTAYQPTLKRSDPYEAIFSESKVEFRCRHGEFDTHTEIAVSPEDDIELRRIIITNRSRTRRAIDITSYAEVVLAPAASDALHPAFSNLFVQTEILRKQSAILCTRRPRSLGEPTPWMFHLMAVHGADTGEVSYETDRSRFIGRGNTVADPRAMNEPAALSGSEGSVLDPIVAIRYQISLDPEESTTINIVSGIGETREACLGLVGKYQDRRLADRVLDLAWTHSQVFLQQINATEADAQLYGRLAGSVLYANSSLRADPGLLIKNRRGQSGLWGYSISGDLPIVLLRIGDTANISLVRQLVQAHAYWRLKGLEVDLVIWNEDHAGYRQILNEEIMGLIADGVEANGTDRPGAIFVRFSDQISNEDRILIQTVARAIITDRRGALADQISHSNLEEITVPSLMPTRKHRPAIPTVDALPRKDLTFYNGLGGFTPDGREYVITTTHGQVTPSPWVNVIANPHFGTIISESGPVCTWSENAHEFRLTPWNNDLVSDSRGEAFYLRDEERGHFWSPTPLPCRGTTPYVTRHGFGYSVFEYTERGIRTEVWIYVALDAAIKFTVLKVCNESERPRRLSATGYVEWVLGDLRQKSAMHIMTEIDPVSGALFARNPFNTEFCDRTAFFDVDEANRTISCDRTEFIGRNGTLRSPAAMTRMRLSGRMGAAMDPCAAIQVSFELAAGQKREIVFRLGVGRDTDDARNLINRFRGSTAAHGSLDVVWQHWSHTLGAVNVETPDQSLNVLANGWLLYQTIACRLWARSGAYQPGGAFGFRDQLQDGMAIIHAKPGLLREHLLRCAARQFRAGDVQHWWHPPSGRGVRTRCSDDYLWLPLAICRYVLGTGDNAVLDEPIHFIEGRPLNPEEDSYYDLPRRSEETASLYEHGRRALLRGLRFGEHGLPLIGSGDWNDGMNIVGENGKGESVWLGFFLYEVLMQFKEVARAQGDLSFVERCQKEAVQLRQNIRQNSWDGEWYLRAYFDDGSPLGSASNPECQIDSIAQSWSVLSGAGDTDRSRQAMEAVYKRLVRRDHALIQLLDPPFDKSDLNPGYIKGYVQGVRENGGQYTHAAIWVVMAFAALGESQRAWELFTMINPVNHAKSPEDVATYKVEPYVVSADVYALSPHTGRGGWTWYTGSAGWMYRLIIESLLGLKLEVDKLHVAPCFPLAWKGFKVHYRYRETVYHITVLKTCDENGEMRVTVDGVEQDDKDIPLIDDHQEHSVEVKINE